ncbi:MAG: lytic transglycosylase domain-containing protein [Anaerovibrio sp.]|nr:lytic transglycosylase domain-containing protein [Anaerovibrio sp.]
MMRIEGLESVVQRINELNDRFGLSKPAYNANAAGKNSFAAELKAAEGKLDPTKDFSGTKVEAASFGGDTSALINEAASKYHVDPRLVAAIAQTESGGNQEAVSSAGAVGVMQLMPDTAAALGVDPYNKQQNIDGGAKYIKEMLDTFNGDVKKAVAAYNAGPQAVKDYGGVPPYIETQNYVNKVLDIYR